MKVSILLTAGVLTATLLSTPIQALTDCTFTTVGTTMTLDADCTTDATIPVPDGFTLDGDGHSITAEDPLAGHFVGAIIENAGPVAHVKNLVLTADSLINTCDGGGNRLRGILFDGASGSISNNSIIDVNQGAGSGCQEGNGIEARNDPFDGSHPNTLAVSITGNVITNFQKNGITANGDVAADIQGNLVTGLGPVPGIAQNGIQIGFGATGKAKNNTIAGSWFTGANWTAAGLLIFESDGVQAIQNNISSNQVGVAVEAWCFFAPSASGNQVVNNNLQDNLNGISVLAFDFFSSCDAMADDNKITSNMINHSTDGGDTGIIVGAFFANVFSPTADNNKVTGNKIKGYETAIEDAGSGSKIHGNRIPSLP